MAKISVRLLIHNVFYDSGGHSLIKWDGEKCQTAKLDILQGHAESIMTDDMHPVFPVNTGEE